LEVKVVDESFVPHEKLVVEAILEGRAVGDPASVIGRPPFGNDGANGAPKREDHSEAAQEMRLRPFLRRWREHFLRSLEPKHLPPFWKDEEFLGRTMIG
jgi:hypothetical protein